MQTDITLEAIDHKLIIDTKYYGKTLSIYYDTEKFHSNNLYQIYSYSAFELIIAHGFRDVVSILLGYMIFY